MSQRFWIPLVLIAAGIAGIALGRLVLAPVPQQPPDVVLESGTWLTPPRPIPSFDLLDEDGRAATTDALQGRWTLAFFGFTHCPEACPTTLAMLGRVRRELTTTVPATAVPSVLLVSVDPERDTPGVLKSYLAGFGPGFRGLTGDPDAVRAFATALGVPYRKIPLDDDYMMDHSTAVLLVNPRGELAALFAAPQTADTLLADLRRIIAAR